MHLLSEKSKENWRKNLKPLLTDCFLGAVFEGRGRYLGHKRAMEKSEKFLGRQDYMFLYAGKFMPGMEKLAGKFFFRQTNSCFYDHRE